MYGLNLSHRGGVFAHRVTDLANLKAVQHHPFNDVYKDAEECHPGYVSPLRDELPKADIGASEKGRPWALRLYVGSGDWREPAST